MGILCWVLEQKKDVSGKVPEMWMKSDILTVVNVPGLTSYF